MPLHGRVHSGAAERHGGRCVAPTAPLTQRTPLSLRTALSAAAALANAPPAERLLFEADLGPALQIASAAHTSKTSAERERVFAAWAAFCESLEIHPSLSNVNGHEAKVVVLLVFAWRYRVGGRRGARKEPVRSDTVASALLAVGKGITDLGQQDPRFEIFGTN